MEHVLKENDFVLVVDELGEIPRDRRRLGFYYKDTRYLSILEMTIQGQSPRLLASSSDQDFQCNVRLANPTITLPDSGVILARSIHVERTLILKDGLRQKISICSHAREPVTVSFTMVFGADFYDVLEVRGLQRERRGTLASPTFDLSTLTLSYTGLDKIRRRTDIYFDPKPAHVELEESSHDLLVGRTSTFLPEATQAVARQVVRPACGHVTWDLVLEQGSPQTISIDALAGEGRPAPTPAPYTVSLAKLRSSYEDWMQECAHFNSNQEHLNELLRRSVLDLRLLTQQEESGTYLDGGVPWFACLHASASIVAALQTLMLNPGIAASTLRYLARWQGKEVNPVTGEEPGKIVQEIRKGETTRSLETPFHAYYGGGANDATPLYVMLFVEAMKWSNDDGLFEELMPSIRSALQWMDQYGDPDHDGFFEYGGSLTSGEAERLWIDTRSLVLEMDGRPTEPPLALARIQGLHYRALQSLSELMRRKGDRSFADRAGRKAQALKSKFNRSFWSEKHQYFGSSLDSHKELIDIVTSWPGILLYCGIVDESKAGQVVKRLVSADLSTGWGIRTRAGSERNYNPMSYAEGSVWPQENSFIAAGMRCYGFDEEAENLMSQLFEASLCFPYHRLPQLYCGFDRGDAPCGPANYPVACTPYATSAGAPLQMVQTMLGISPDAPSNRLLVSPRLPPWVGEIEVRDLAIGKGTVDLQFIRRGQETCIEVSRNEAGAEIVVAPRRKPVPAP